MNMFRSSAGRRSVTALTVGAVALSVALAGCSANGSGPSSNSTSSAKLSSVSFANQSNDGALFNQIQTGLVAASKTMKVTLKTYNNNSDQATTLSNAKQMVLDKPDVAIDWNPVSEAGARLGQTFTSANVPCIAMNTPIAGCHWFNQDNEYLAQEVAKPMAAYMKAKGWDGSNTTIVIMQAATVGPAVNIAVTEAYSALSKIVPKMTPIEASKITPQTTTIGSSGLQINDAPVTLAGAYTSMQQALQTVDKSRHIVLLTVDDDFTVGAMRAIDQAGRTSDSLVSGFGCDADAIKALRAKGSWVTEPCTFPSAWGEYTLAMATALKSGVTPPKQTTAPQATLTRDNVDTYFAPGETSVAKELPALDSGNKYLAKTGVLQKFGNVKGVN